MHYGVSSILNPSQTWGIPGCAGPTVTIIKDQTSFVSLSGSAANPNASSSAASLCVTGAPPLNMVYKFVPSGSGVKEIDNNIPVTIFPNPCNGIFTLVSDFYSTGKSKMHITNNLGQIVFEEKTFEPGAGNMIQSNLQPGVYFVHVSNDQAGTVKKLVVR